MKLTEEEKKLVLQHRAKIKAAKDLVEKQKIANTIGNSHVSGTMIVLMIVNYVEQQNGNDVLFTKMVGYDQFARV